MNKARIGIGITAVSLALFLALGPAGRAQARPRKMQSAPSWTPKHDESTKGKYRHPDRHTKKPGEHTQKPKTKQ
ncbi:MAG TPA: hypothetical protein P5287_06555 [bacterium]|nr:hypothetical protein [bacterium]